MHVYRIRHKESPGEYWDAAAGKWVGFMESTRFMNKSGVAMPAGGEWIDMAAVYKQVDEAKQQLVTVALKAGPVVKAFKALKTLEEFDLGPELNEEMSGVARQLGAWLGRRQKIVKEAPPELTL